LLRWSLGERREEAKKQTMHQETKTKLSSAALHRKRSTPTQTQKKASRQQWRSGISTSPTPCCESLRQEHLNNSKHHGALEKIRNMQAGRRGWTTSNQQPCFSESCHPVTLAKVLLFVKAAQKVTAASHFLCMCLK
jgi:hypothetical protein